MGRGYMSLNPGEDGREYLNMFVSFYLHLNKYIDSDHLRHIYLASFSSPADFSQESGNLVP